MKKNDDKRLLSEQKIKNIATRLLGVNPNVRIIAKMNRVTTKTVRAIQGKLQKLGDITALKINQMSPNETIKAFYPGLDEPRTRSDSENKLLPDFVKIAEAHFETKKKLADFYKEYQKEAVASGKGQLSRAYYFRRLSAEIELKKKEHPDCYLAQDFDYGYVLQLDFTGDKYKVLTDNGLLECEILVMAWPTSYYTFAQFVTREGTVECIRALTTAFRAWGGKIPNVIFVDNAKCFVYRHDGAEAVYIKQFEDYLREVGICLDAAPIRHPQAKSAAEHCVNCVQTAMKSIKKDFRENLRTLEEHNRFLQAKIDDLVNRAPFRGDDKKTREYLFRTYELPCCNNAMALPMPALDQITRTVPSSYHVTYEQHEYSVPFTYIGTRVDIYIGQSEIVIKSQGDEIARHLRTDGEGRTTVTEHMPKDHQDIVRNAKMYETTDDVLKVCKFFPGGVRAFCAKRIARDEGSAQSNKNTIRACRAVINGYKDCADKPLYDQACRQVITLPSTDWTSYKVKEVYKELCKEYAEKHKVAHQTEIFRDDGGNSHLRKDDGTGSGDGQNGLDDLD